MDGNGAYGISNSNSIGIEICINSDGNYETAFSNAIELTKSLMKKYNIPVTRVVRHYDASRKSCPNSMKANNWAKWNTFRQRLTGSSVPLKTTQGTVTADVLNVRNSPSTSGAIIGSLTAGTVVDIAKKVGNWYDIYFGNSGGYVSADYIKTSFGQSTNTPKPSTPDSKPSTTQHRNCVVYANEVDMRAALYLTDWFNIKGEDCICKHVKEYSPSLGRSTYGVGGGLDGVKCTVYLKGNGRLDTLEVVLKRMGWKISR